MEDGSGHPPVGGNETILLVEDESLVLAMTKTMLELHGYHVLAAGSPGKAIGLAETYPGHIDLLITDVVMPEMNGSDLAKHLLASRPDLKRLFMSGYTADVVAHHGVLSEGIHFVQKPFVQKDLIAKIRMALEDE
jgi:CheY-like chemotaxis protein